MRTLYLLVFSFIFSVGIYAQSYEVGVTVGATNFVGDTGNTTFIRPSDVGFGVIGRWNRSLRHSFRFSAAFLNISADDQESDDPRKQIRGFEFDNSIKELSAGIEYTFWEWDLHSAEKQIVPYLYTGLTGFSFGDIALANDGTFKAFDDTWSLAIPIVLGVKSNIGRHFVISFELGARYTFTDNIDGSNPENLELPIERNLSFGNLNTNDWYFFNALSLTYTFGRKPCYCGI